MAIALSFYHWKWRVVFGTPTLILTFFVPVYMTMCCHLFTGRCNLLLLVVLAIVWTPKNKMLTTHVPRLWALLDNLSFCYLLMENYILENRFFWHLLVINIKSGTDCSRKNKVQLWQLLISFKMAAFEIVIGIGKWWYLNKLLFLTCIRIPLYQ